MNKEQLILYLESEGFSKNVINAFKEVRRENFISKTYKSEAYENAPILIPGGQSTSQPYTIAFMLDLLELKDNLKILEVGSGSGYVLALLNQISKNSEIYGIERIKELVNLSKKHLKENKNIHVVFGDGNYGLKEKAKFDRILVSASARQIPRKLLSQLNQNGIMVCVVKNSIIKINNSIKGNKISEYPGFFFVRLVNESNQKLNSSPSVPQA